jgi:hypothetical protein
VASELIERDLYAGSVHLVHNPTARGSAPRYKVLDEEGKIVSKPRGVTTILGQTLFKDLIGWALGCMAEYLEEKLPVITKEDLDEAQKESTTRRDKGASTGTEAHALVEAYLKGKKPSLATSTSEAKKAYGAFKKWFEATKPEIINVEEVIYSQEFQYAGTYDCMLRIDGKVYLCDLKTTNASKSAPAGVYAENFLQLGAYASAHDEQRLYEDEHAAIGEETELEVIEGLMVISAKKDGKLDIVTNEDVNISLEDCREMFKRVINLYNFLKYTKGELGGK